MTISSLFAGSVEHTNSPLQCRASLNLGLSRRRTGLKSILKRKPREKVARPPRAKTSRKDVIAAEPFGYRCGRRHHCSSGRRKQLDQRIDVQSTIGLTQTLAVKGYIQVLQEDREDFIIGQPGAGATKFNKWMKKAGLAFNKQSWSLGPAGRREFEAQRYVLRDSPGLIT